jgi:hypothetical protein
MKIATTVLGTKTACSDELSPTIKRYRADQYSNHANLIGNEGLKLGGEGADSGDGDDPPEPPMLSLRLVAGMWDLCLGRVPLNSRIISRLL